MRGDRDRARPAADADLAAAPERQLEIARDRHRRVVDDVHNACAANVANSGALLKLAYIPSGDPTQCGASAANTKVLWCALSSPTPLT